MPSRLLAPLGLLLLTASLAACGADVDVGHPPATSQTSPVPLPTKEPPKTVRERCYVEAPGDIFGLASADGASSLSGVTYGQGDTAAVFLHQTGAGGLCGWVPFAMLVADDDVRAVLVDDCLHGASRCEPPVTGDALAQTRIAVDWARAHGARRVVVVGASMGGAVALATAQDAGADAVVDLSGPARWQGVAGAVEAATATSIPLYLAVAGDDLQMGIPTLRQAAKASPAQQKRFVLAKDGHGWELTSTGTPPDTRITPLGRQVLAWIHGDYASVTAGRL